MDEEASEDGPGPGGSIRVVETLRSSGEQRVVLRNVGWGTYELLMAEREERRVPRFYYDRGMMEIVRASVSREHILRVKRARVIHHAGSSPRFPSRRSMPRARDPTIHHRAHLGAV